MVFDVNDSQRAGLVPAVLRSRRPRRRGAFRRLLLPPVILPLCDSPLVALPDVDDLLTLLPRVIYAVGRAARVSAVQTEDDVGAVHHPLVARLHLGRVVAPRRDDVHLAAGGDDAVEQLSVGRLRVAPPATLLTLERDRRDDAHLGFERCLGECLIEAEGDAADDGDFFVRVVVADSGQ